MENLKFRAWNNVEGKWLDKDRVVISNGSIYVNGTAFEYGTETDATLEMFTGICDKTGKEVYEGDVVVITYEQWRKYAVEYWGPGWGSFVLVENGKHFEATLADYEDIVVVGNIHE